MQWTKKDVTTQAHITACARLVWIGNWKTNMHVVVNTKHLYYLNSAEAQGMESGVISNSQMSASSQWSNLERAHCGRLHVKETQHNAGGRVARTNDENQWLQIDLNNRYIEMTKVASQGRNSLRWRFRVTNYNLTYSKGGIKFLFYKEREHNEAKVW